MKKSLHPDNYRLMVFEDLNNGFRFLTRATAATDETTKWEDGNEYPLVKVHITSTSHPFFTAGAAAKEAKRTAAKIAKAEAKAENAKPVAGK
jgi:large subunit ribosomal protein L31